MFKGYPDFQSIIIKDQQKLVSAFGQSNLLFIMPEKMSVYQDGSDLYFQLDVIRSYTGDEIYGKLNFTTILDYNEEIKSAFPGKSLTAVAVNPYKMSFSSPSQHPSNLDKNQYEATWYNAGQANYVILLDTVTTELIDETLRNDIVGFQSRLDGFVEGVSPRFNSILEFNPRELVNAFSRGLNVNDDVFDYLDLQDYIFKNLTNIPLSLDPQLPSSDLLSSAILDRIFNSLGSLVVGPVNTNASYIKLDGSEEGRKRLDLNETVLVKRPTTFLMDPFAAAQQIAKKDPDEIIHRYTAPPIPSGSIPISVYYSLPYGLSKSIKTNIQVTVPKGYYPQEQSKTVELPDTKQKVELDFKNNFVTDNTYYYQIFVDYMADQVHKQIDGLKTPFKNEHLVLNNTDYPCQFLTIEIDPNFARTSKLVGTFYSMDDKTSFELTSESPFFSHPQLSHQDYAELTAESLKSGEKISLGFNIVTSMTIGDYSFSEFGSQQVTFIVDFTEGKNLLKVTFEPQGSDAKTERVFTPDDNKFQYKWNSESIYEARFRYRVEGKDWSQYQNPDQTITIEA